MFHLDECQIQKITIPFPILIIDGLEVSKSYQEIAPSLWNVKEDNNRCDLTVDEIKNTGFTIADILQDFENVMDTNFLQFVFEFFSEFAPVEYAFNLQKIKECLDCDAIGRKQDNVVAASRQVLLSCNTPVKKAGSVRQIHLDYPDKYLTGLIYVDPGVDSGGEGDLIIYKWKKWVPRWLKFLTYNEVGSHLLIDQFMRICPKPGRAVFFLNGLNSLHGVAPRSATEKFRIFYNYIIEGDENVYSTLKSKIREFRLLFN